MLSFILFFIALYLFLWLLPRLWLLFKAAYLLKSKIEKSADRSRFDSDYRTSKDASPFYGEGGRHSQKIEKDISHRVKIIEEKSGDA